MEQWIQPDEPVNEFVRKYPLSVEIFEENLPDEMTMGDYAKQQDIEIKQLEEEMARQLTQQATGHEDCAFLCFSAEFCDKKRWLVGAALILLVLTFLIYFNFLSIKFLGALLP